MPNLGFFFLTTHITPCVVRKKMLKRNRVRLKVPYHLFKLNTNNDAIKMVTLVIANFTSLHKKLYRQDTLRRYQNLGVRLKHLHTHRD